MQILLCETEPLIREMIFEYVSPLGFKLIAADNYHRCREIFAVRIPDVIILDTHMRSLSVVQAIQKIRHMGHKSPIILLGSNYGITSQEDAVEIGANAFIEKPFKLRDLLEQVMIFAPA